MQVIGIVLWGIIFATCVALSVAFYVAEMRPRWLTADFWTHETIDTMQARMLREVWARYHEMRGGNATWYPSDGSKPIHIYLTNADFVNDLSDAQREADRIVKLWSPHAKRVIDEVKARGPFGYMAKAVEQLEREITL